MREREVMRKRVKYSTEDIIERRGIEGGQTREMDDHDKGITFNPLPVTIQQ